jgi:hypothetical protein
MKTILLTLLLASTALAEDCYYPSPQTNINIAPVIETYRYNPKVRLKAQVKRRTKRKEVDTFAYFINRKAKSVKASFATLGYDMSYGVGRKKDLKIALKIAQGWEKEEDFLGWLDDRLQFEHELSVYETQCEMRNECRAFYKDKQLLTACFKELRLWPSLRKMLPKRKQIISTGELVTYRAR